jgi:hypothetical protein
VGDEVNDQDEMVFMVLDTKPTKKAEQQVKHSVDECECLTCQGKGKLRRGLCIKCYTSWSRTRAKLSPREAMKFDAKLIRLGYLLSPQQVRRIRQDSIFERLTQ